MEPSPQRVRSHGPKAATVFAAAFVAGAAAAFCINRALDIHIAQSKPQVESEPIFVALRGLPQGAQVTVWDVGLREWPKAMVPGTAMRPHDSLEGLIVKHPLREGQPILSVQLGRATGGEGGQLASIVPLERPPVVAANQLPAYDLWSDEKQPATTAAKTPDLPRTNPADAAPPAESVSAVAPPAPANEPVAEPAPPTSSPAVAETAAPALAELIPAAPQTPTVAETAAPQAPAKEPELVSVLPAKSVPAPGIEASVSANALPQEPAVAAPADTAASVPNRMASATRPAAQTSSRRPTFNRYLVVPERIAMQADAMTVPAPQPPAELPQITPARSQPRPTAATAGKTISSQQQRQRPQSKTNGPQKTTRVAR